MAEDTAKRIAEVEDELKQRDRRIRELRQELDDERALIGALREHLQDARAIQDSWIEAFNMVPTDGGGLTWAPFRRRRGRPSRRPQRAGAGVE